MKKPKLGFKRPSVSAFRKTNLVWPIALIVSAIGLLGYKLLSLVPFFSHEQTAYHASATLSAIKNDIIFAPVKGLQLFILKFSEDDSLIRLASVFTALVAACMLFIVLRKWHTNRVSTLTTLMFITSTAFLQYGRSANTEVLYLVLLPALLLASLWAISTRSHTKFSLAAIVIGLILYIPGGLLFTLATVIFLRKAFIKSIRSLGWLNITASIAAFIATISPLIYSLALKPGQLWQWIGFGPLSDMTPNLIGSRLVDIPNQLFFQGIDSSAAWIIGTPIFDVFSVAMIIIGAYAYRAGLYPTREKLVFGSIIIGVILLSIGNVGSVLILLPAMYLLIANGLSYLLQSWFTVFPRNPVARSVGLVIAIILVTMSCFYQVQRYFVAWPETISAKISLTDDRTSVTLLK